MHDPELRRVCLQIMKNPFALKMIGLHGIDAPESNQMCESGGVSYRCGQKSALALSDRAGRATVSCKGKDVDRYGRIVAVCFKGQEDLNAWMVSQGWAVSYPSDPQDFNNASPSNSPVLDDDVIPF
mgnify:FL=1|jgi:endonuclease YncB( thermonuclease family)